MKPNSPQQNLQQQVREHMLAAVRAIVEPGTVVELRAIDVPAERSSFTQAWAGYFNDPEALVNAAVMLDGKKAPGIYITPNPVRPDLLARCSNRVKAAGKKDSITHDADIVSRRWLLVDVDPKRPSGISSSDSERAAAVEVVGRVKSFLAASGWSAPIEADSGNGFHLMYRVALPNDEANTDLIARCLRALAAQFSTPEAAVDTTVSNAARIWKLYGTVARKGDSTPDRPHRRAKLLADPGPQEPILREQLEALAILAPEDEKRTTRALSPDRPAGSAPSSDLVTRARKYLEAVPAAVSGANGDAETFKVACKMVVDFALSEADAMSAMEEWNARCSPPWSDQDLLEKIRRAARYGKGTPGRLSDAPAPKRETPTRETTNRETGTRTPLPAGTTAEEIRSQYTPARDTDLGNAERLAEHIAGGLLFCREAGWLCWDGKRWQMDDLAARRAYREHVIPSVYREAAEAALRHDQAMVKSLASWAKRSETAARIDGALEMLKTFPGVSIPREALDNDQWALNCINGTIDLRTGTLKPHNRADLNTRMIQTQYDPAAKCPEWERFLVDIFAGDRAMAEWIQLAVGYSLTGDTREQCFFVLHGNGRNGKSTFVNTIMDLLGQYSLETQAETLMVKQGQQNNTNDLARLAGARLVSANETEENQRLAEARVKALTGGDKITARFLHREFFDFRPCFKLWLRSNHRPVIRGTDDGIWRRIWLIPFNVCFKGREDKNLADKLRAEAPGILAWAVRGCLAWQKNGISMPAAVAAATQGYRESQDMLSGFLGECCVTGPRARHMTARARDLYKAYTSWCEDSGERPMSQRRLGEALTERGMVRRRGAGNVCLWDGIGIASEYPALQWETGDEPQGVTESYPLHPNDNHVKPGTHSGEAGAPSYPCYPNSIVSLGEKENIEKTQISGNKGNLVNGSPTPNDDPGVAI